jgi:uncharacterized protein YjiS (DUF1127 family)
MTILEDIASLTHAHGAPRQLSRILRRARRLIDNTVAAVIAHRQRQADFVLLQHLGDRELKDIGLHRSQIEYGLAELARERARQQVRDRRASPGRIER